MSDGSLFHAGEVAIQARMDGRAQAERIGRRNISPVLPMQHRVFYAGLPFVILGGLDARRHPHATIASGPPGFARSPEPRALVIDAELPAGDALEGSLIRGAPVGVLGMDPSTRRRNRVNGRILRTGPLIIGVEQAFGNCPQYIRQRTWTDADHRPGPARSMQTLDDTARGLIEQADTFFLATAHPDAGDGDRSHGVDASHRGGRSGFVAVRGDQLLFPDYRGNGQFNSLGNLMLDPRIGLLFVDFARGDLLQVSGRAEIEWDGPRVDGFLGAQRLVVVTIDGARSLPGALPWRTVDGDLTPATARRTGTWSEATGL